MMGCLVRSGQLPDSFWPFVLVLAFSLYAFFCDRQPGRGMFICAIGLASLASLGAGGIWKVWP